MRLTIIIENFHVSRCLSQSVCLSVSRSVSLISVSLMERINNCSLCLPVCLPACLPVCPSLSLSLCLICLFLSLSLYFSVSASLMDGSNMICGLPLSLSVSVSVSLCLCLSVCLFLSPPASNEFKSSHSLKRCDSCR